MDKIIKAIGTSKGIIFNKDECIIYDLHVGDIVEVIINKTTISRENKDE